MTYVGINVRISINFYQTFGCCSLISRSLASFGSEQIVQIAMDKTAVVAALGNVRIGSTANNKTSTGGTGKANAVSARAIVGTTETPVKPAADTPVTIPKTITSRSL